MAERSDTERLDWLELNKITMITQISDDIEEGFEVRAAIDRAMEGWEWDDEPSSDFDEDDDIDY
jgi:hypothetical protein